MAGNRVTPFNILQDMRKEVGLPPAPKKEPALLITPEIKAATIRYVIRTQFTEYSDPKFVANAAVMKSLKAAIAAALKDVKSRKLSLSELGLDSSAAVTAPARSTTRKPSTPKAPKAPGQSAGRGRPRKS